MRTQKRKPAPEKAEERPKPVKATTTPPADHAATDALLDTIEAVLDEATVEEQKPEPASDTWPSVSEFMAMILDTTPSPWLTESFFTPEPEPQPEDDIPWEEIARMPPPPPGGTAIRYMVRPEIEWAELRDDPSPMVIRSNDRNLLVTREMWEEAQARVRLAGRQDPRMRFWDRPQRRSYYGGDDGLCPKCGWPKAGPGRSPCNTAIPNPIEAVRKIGDITSA